MGCDWVGPLETPDIVLNVLDEAINSGLDESGDIISFKQRVEAHDSSWLDNCVN